MISSFLPSSFIPADAFEKSIVVLTVEIKKKFAPTFFISSSLLKLIIYLQTTTTTTTPPTNNNNNTTYYQAAIAQATAREYKHLENNSIFIIFIVKNINRNLIILQVIN